MGIPRGVCLRKSNRVGAMLISTAAPGAEAQVWGQVTALNGPSPPQPSGRLSPVPPLRGPVRAPPESHGRCRVPSHPRPAPSSAAQDPRGGRQRKKGRAGEGGVTSGRSHSPRSGTFLGRGKGSGEGNGGEGGKEAPTPRAAPRARVFHRLATPGRRRTPERAWGRAQARLGVGGRPGGGGYVGTDLAFGFPV